MTINNKKIQIDDKWMDDFSSLMAIETHKLLDTKAGKTDKALSKLLIKQYVAKFIALVVHKSLKEKPSSKLNKEEEYKFVSNNFAEAKLDIQEAVSLAFGETMTNFTKKQVEYYCKISPVPPIANKEPC